MRANEIRGAFLEFFRRQGHEILKSSSLIPADDPSLLFTNAGMVQFKRVFLGEDTPAVKRAVTCQKCVRAGGKHSDIENVGHTARHHSFFEMLGNFSFGDYFKKEAIGFAWRLLTEGFGVPAGRLWVSVYEEDDEAAALWQEAAGLPAGRIVRLGAKDNFWQMAETGPCGPCSEIIIDQGEQLGCGRPGCAVGCDCDRYLELWNLVFMQFNRDETGTLTPLPSPSIDTGMGLERIAAVLQGKTNNFDTDIFAPIIASIEALSGVSYYGADAKQTASMRVMADHLRAIAFLVSDGLVPSNEGRGYVLRRIIRRAARYSRNLGMEGPVLWKMTDAVVSAMSDTYPELLREAGRTRKVLRFEEERFSHTLEQGMGLLDNILRTLKGRGAKVFPGGEVFRLYDTFGFPVDLVRDVASEEGFLVDEEGFSREMQAQRERARAAWVQEDGAAESIYRELASELGSTVFTGYETMSSGGVVRAIVKDGHTVNELEEGGEAEVILDRTPFYGESGGQAGDTGVLYADGTLVEVLDAKRPVESLIAHRARVKKGSLRVWAKLTCSVDEEKRRATMRNHTATHLLQAALRSTLGEHVKQAGSLVEPERLRFDFTHFSGLDASEIEAVEDFVNARILENIPVETAEMQADEAIARGATALFGERYGERVRVVSTASVSMELCGGTHVGSTGQIGPFAILSEGSVASGIRRIEAMTGAGALEHFRRMKGEFKEIAKTLRSDKPLERIAELLERLKAQERELQKAKAVSAKDMAREFAQGAKTVNGVKVLAEKVEGFSQKELRELADAVRDRLGSGVIVLASSEGALLAVVTKELTNILKAGDILNEVASLAGGRGGGKPELAQGGTKDIEKLDTALPKVYDIVRKRLGK